MHLRSATLATAAVLVTGLGLAACNPADDGAKAKDGSSPSITASSTSASSSTPPDSTASATAGSTAGKSGNAGTTAVPAGKKTGSAAVSACTTKTTTVRFIASASHASESEPAAATVKVTNISGRTCTLVGATALTAKDDQGKAAPIETDNAAAGTDAVDIAAGSSATADVLYTDINSAGSESAREVCAVQASEVQIALPKDIARTVKVTKANGSAGVFSVCSKDVKFGSFHS